MNEYTFCKNHLSSIVNSSDYKFEEVFHQFPADVVQQVFFDASKNAFTDIFSFLESETKILSLTGFRGCGKTSLMKLAKNVFAPETLVFEHNFSISVSIDDIILNFYRNIESYCVKHQVNALNFRHKKTYSEKVISFLKNIKMPSVIILDSINNVFINDKLKNNSKFFDFINFLSEFANIKIIILSRNSDHMSYLNKSAAKIKLGPLDTEDFYKVLDLHEHNKLLIDDFYSQSRGYLLNLAITIDLIDHQQANLSGLLSESTNQSLTFDEFLYKKYLNYISTEFMNTLKMLSITRVGFTIDMIKELNLRVDEYLTKKFLFESNSSVFMHDYFAKLVFNGLSRQERCQIHAFLMEIFEKQIEMNLKDRKLNLSRTTLHNEYDYHKTYSATEFSEVTPKQSSKGNFAYISSAAKASFDWNLKNVKHKNQNTTSKIDTNTIPLTAEDIEDIEDALTKEELMLLESQNESPIVETSIVSETEVYEIQEIPERPIIKTYQDFLRDAQKSEERFDFSTAIYYYEKALSSLPAENEDKKPFILTKLALSNEKLNNYESTIKIYKEALAIYQAKGQTNKANYILLNIANSYKATFEYEEAFNIYEKILSSDPNETPKLQILQAFVGIADYYEYKQNSKQTLSYLLKSLNLAQELNDDVALSEVNFKLALLLDETGNGESALKYYQKSIEISKTCSKKDFISSAYANVATIYKEKGDYKNALENYKQALQIDMAANNLDGIIFTYQKMAEIYADKNQNLAIEYLHNALNCAKKTKDGYYLASSYLALGDFYFNAKMYEKAIKSYIFAKHSYGKNISSENKAKIEMRFTDVKAIIGEAKYRSLIVGINK